jgi:Tfp pilus assembly pilus retraction ATPase PilT
MNTSPTKEEMILPNAAPMITPTARSTTLPFMANSLNSEARLIVLSLEDASAGWY